MKYLSPIEKQFEWFLKISFFLIAFYSNKYLTFIFLQNALIKFCWLQLSESFIDGRKISLFCSEPKKTKTFSKKTYF